MLFFPLSFALIFHCNCDGMGRCSTWRDWIPNGHSLSGGLALPPTTTRLYARASRRTGAPCAARVASSRSASSGYVHIHTKHYQLQFEQSISGRMHALSKPHNFFRFAPCQSFEIWLIYQSTRLDVGSAIHG